MTWRLGENLIEATLDNSESERVHGWIVFKSEDPDGFRVDVDFCGNLPEQFAGKAIHIVNPDIGDLEDLPCLKHFSSVFEGTLNRAEQVGYEDESRELVLEWGGTDQAVRLSVPETWIQERPLALN